MLLVKPIKLLLEWEVVRFPMDTPMMLGLICCIQNRLEKEVKNLRRRISDIERREERRLRKEREKEREREWKKEMEEKIREELRNQRQQ